jgi:formylglycine-generating enzyme required for sulfatase activity
MGSRANEPGRYDYEGPCHAVTIGEGFWLFDTPCTQALWQAVMGDNPCRFKSPTRPVETVSFEDAKRFLSAIIDRLPGLDLVLPSEAQWEYACRAGIDDATYAGPIKILGRNNAPVLDKIAWYGGNSGEGFELDDGYDSSKWPEKQYYHTKAGTRPVKGKNPNAWGLYDMLGNVWERCEDNWHDSYEGAPSDGSAWLDTRAALRVIRGGSWGGGARNVRAACRRWDEPGDRLDSLGFRCARGQLA